MNNKVKGLLAFVAGATVGAAATYFVVKTKYERLAENEINSVKEVFAKRETELLSHCDEIRDEVAVEKLKINMNRALKPDLAEIVSKVKQELSTVVETEATDETYDYYEDDEAEEVEDIPEEPKQVEPPQPPYVILPEEFGTEEDYELIDLTYFSDGVLTDDWDNPIEDVEDMVGLESLDHIGEYAEDTIHVRNEKYKADFEITLDEREYSEVLASRPRHLGVVEE